MTNIHFSFKEKCKLNLSWIIHESSLLESDDITYFMLDSDIFYELFRLDWNSHANLSYNRINKA